MAGARAKTILKIIAVVVAVLAALAAALAVFISQAADDNIYPSPYLSFKGYGALQEELADFLGVRFPDLSEYGDEGDFDCIVSADRKNGVVDGRSYNVAFADCPIGIHVDCRDLAQFDGHYSVAPEVNPIAWHAGVEIGIQTFERELADDEVNPLTEPRLGGRTGCFEYAFAVDGYYHKVEVRYGISAAETEADSQAARKRAEEAAQAISYSIIEQ